MYIIHLSSPFNSVCSLISSIVVYVLTFKSSKFNFSTASSASALAKRRRVDLPNLHFGFGAGRVFVGMPLQHQLPVASDMRCTAIKGPPRNCLEDVA